jgi:hypothetical protein
MKTSPSTIQQITTALQWSVVPGALGKRPTWGSVRVIHVANGAYQIDIVEHTDWERAPDVHEHLGDFASLEQALADCPDMDQALFWISASPVDTLNADESLI